MHHSSRAMGRQLKKPRMPETVAAATSPVAGPQSPQAPTEPVVDGAKGISGRARGIIQGAPAPRPVIPTPPPTIQPPRRITPLVLFVSQTLLDMAAIAGAFSLAYLVRFYTDILPRFVQPDVPTYTTMLAVTLATII